MQGSVDLKVRLEVTLAQDGDRWVAGCEPLDLYSQGSTSQGAVQSLREAISGWFESCLERRVLAKALEEVGFRLAQDSEPLSANGRRLSDSKSGDMEVEEVEISIPAYIAAEIAAPPHASR